MAAIEIELPNGERRTYPEGTTGLQVAGEIGRRLAADAAVVKLGDRVLDATRPLDDPTASDGPAADPDAPSGPDAAPEAAPAPSAGAAVRPASGPQPFRVLTPKDPEGLFVYRHTTTHVMAQAVRRLWPGTRLAIGPVIEDGFYYDMDVRDAQGNPVRLTDEDLPRIEEQMAEVIRADYPVAREVWSRDAARAYFERHGEPYKVEIVDGLPPGAEITVYTQGEFTDLCRGPHLPSTGRIRPGAFKLLSVAGAYWRGDERRPMLQRVYGTAFAAKEELDRFLWRREEARRRDHRRLGPELGLFLFRDEAPGFPLWLPRGYTLYRTLENFSRELQEKRGYQEVATPVIFRSALYERSGHWQHYRENMYDFRKDDEWFAVKPMNCPAHCLVYASQTRSYRDLPLRLAEYGQLVRYERSGTLHGLLRVRSLHQDDAHLFVREDQIEDEIRDVIGLVDELYGAFGMRYEVRLSTRPDDAMGEPELWEKAERALAGALEKAGRPYALNPGDGAFYGPKLDFYVEDALGRRWQCPTVQLDFQFPQRFDLTYADADGREKRPVMIHRAVMGTLERFIGILTEHFAGAFPTWLAPEQVRVVTVADRHEAYARQVVGRLRAAGVRAELDARNDKIGYKVRRAQVEKVPYMLAVGDREAAGGTVAVRPRQGEQRVQPLEAFLRDVTEEIAQRRLQGEL
jgi:threonyl-tRNA synthetase